jgi:glycosyltransferase involved in cell wall biosynthesis
MLASVLTCVYNQDSFFFESAARSIASLGSECEWIVVDDGSETNYALVHERIATSYGPAGRTSYVNLRQRQGLSIARNVALEKAKGEWIIVLDSDDELTAAILKSLISAPPKTGLLSLAAEYFCDSPSFLERRPVSRYARLYSSFGGTLLDPFLWFDFYYHGIVARRRVLLEIGGYDPSLKVGEDQDVLLRAAYQAGVNSVHFCDYVSYRYRQNPLGVCASRWPDVLSAYTRTMLVAARVRGAHFTECRFGGTRVLDGATVDYYEYFEPGWGWLDWNTAAGRAGVDADLASAS